MVKAMELIVIRQEWSENYNPSTVLSDPKRLPVPNFVKIGRETAK